MQLWANNHPDDDGPRLFVEDTSYLPSTLQRDLRESVEQIVSDRIWTEWFKHGTRYCEPEDVPKLIDDWDFGRTENEAIHNLALMRVAHAHGLAPASDWWPDSYVDLPEYREHNDLVNAYTQRRLVDATEVC